jgi:hypothetical protein
MPKNPPAAVREERKREERNEGIESRMESVDANVQGVARQGVVRQA